MLEALRDPKYWVLAVATMAFSVTNAGITNFNPLITSGYGFSPTQTALMSSPQAAVAIVAQVSATVIMLYVRNVRCIIWVVSTFPAIAGTVMIRSKFCVSEYPPPGLTQLLALDIVKYRTASLAGVYLMGFYNVSFVTLLSLQSSNNSGTTKKSFASVSVAIFYCRWIVPEVIYLIASYLCSHSCQNLPCGNGANMHCQLWEILSGRSSFAPTKHRITPSA